MRQSGCGRRRSFFFDVVLAVVLTGWGAAPLLAAQGAFAVDAIYPSIHPLEGGSNARISGGPFAAGMLVYVGGTEAAMADLYEGMMRIVTPAKSAGSYSVRVVHPTLGEKTILNALRYEPLKLAPMESLSCVVDLEAQQAALRWGHPLVLDRIEVFRNEEFLASLPGGAIGHNAALSGAEGDVFRIVGYREGIATHPATCLATPPICPPQFVPIKNPEQGPVSVSLRGEGADAVRALFIPTEEAPRGLRIEVLYEPIAPGATLMARILRASDGNVQAQGIPIASAPSLVSGLYVLGPAWRVGQSAAVRILEPYVNEPYLLELYAEGGRAGEVAFRVATQNVPPLQEHTAQITYYALNPALLPLRSEDEPLEDAPAPRDLLARVFPIYPEVPVSIERVDFELLHPASYYSTNWIPHAVNFTAILSGGPEAPLTQQYAQSYSWSFGDAKFAVTSSPQVSHKYVSAGNYSVRLTILDFFGKEHEYTFSLVTSHFMEPPPAGEPRISHFTPAGYTAEGPPILSMPPGVVSGIVVDMPVRCLVTPAVDATIVDVRFTVYDRTQMRGVRVGQRSDPDDPDPAAYWEATVNFSESYGHDKLRMEVRAEDSEGRVSRVDYFFPVCQPPHILTIPDLYERRLITYDPELREYTVWCMWDRDLTRLFSQNFTFHPAMGSPVHFVNELQGMVTAKLRMRDRHWYPEAIQLYAHGTFMNSGWGSGLTLAAPAFTGLDLACGNFALGTPPDMPSSVYMDADFGPERWWTGSIQGKTIHLMGSMHAVGEADWDIASMDLIPTTTIHMNARARVDGSITGGEYSDSWAAGFVEIRVKLVGSVEGQADYSFGVVRHGDAVSEGPSASRSSCLRLRMSLDVYSCQCWVLCNSFSLHLVNATLPEGCILDKGAGGGAEDGRPKGSLEDPRWPTVAASPDGALNLIAFQEDTSPDVFPEPDLFFALVDRTGRITPRRMFDDGFVRRDPQVAFLSDDMAICVWVQSRFTRGELRALADDRRLSPREKANAGLGSSEIWYAMWHSRGGWQSPQALTDDRFPDGRPKVAADPANDRVLVVWERAEVGEYFDEDMQGRAEEKVMGFAAIDSRGLVQTSGLVAARDATRIDYAPSIAVSPDGSGVRAVWLRDIDGDESTAADRRLMHSELQAGVWSAPAVIEGNTIAAPLHPSLALSDAQNGLLTFTQPFLSVPDEVPGDATATGVYVMPLRSGTFRTPRPLFHLPVFHRRTPPPAMGRFPQARLLPTGSFAVVYREFGGAGEHAFLGDLSVGVVDISGPSMKTSFVRRLTDDDVQDIDLASAVNSQGDLVIVRQSSGAPAAAKGIAASFISLDVDTAIAAFYLSNPHARPGETVDAIVELRNAGLTPVVAPMEQPPGGGPPQAVPNATVRISYVPSGGGEPVEIASDRVIFRGAPDVIHRLRVPIIVPAQPRQLQAEAWVDDEVWRGNNLISDAPGARFGTRPPVDVACRAEVDGEDVHVLLRWTNGEVYDQIEIFRDGCLLEVLRGTSTAHLDTSVAPGAHTWAIRGVVRGLHSPFGVSDCSILVPEPGVDAPFIRSDSNRDGRVDIGDAIYTLGYLFGGAAEPACLDAVDANDDGKTDIADAIHTLTFLFAGGPSPSPPHPGCGIDPTADGLGCAEFPPCLR